MRADTGQSVVWSKHSRSASEGEARLVVKEGDRIVLVAAGWFDGTAALRELDALAEGTGFVLGHNLIEFEICRFLLAAAPDIEAAAAARPWTRCGSTRWRFPSATPITASSSTTRTLR